MCILNEIKIWSDVWGPVLAAVVTLVGVMVAYLALRRQILSSKETLDALKMQIELSNKSLNINLTLELEKRFNDDKFRELRKKAHESIRNKKFDAVDEVLDFFETVALLVKRNAVDEEIVWHTFFWWIRGYWVTTENYILEKQEKEPSVWEDLRNLYNKLVAIEKDKNPTFSEKLTEDELDEFLNEFEE
jgi:hypothetical protein